MGLVKKISKNTAIAGIMLGSLGCNTLENKELIPDYKYEVHQSYVKGYFSGVYEEGGYRELDKEERDKMLKTFDSYTNETKQYIKNNFSFVNFENPNDSDVRVFSLLEEVLNNYEDYQKIDPKHLTTEQKKDFKEYGDWRKEIKRELKTQNMTEEDRMFLYLMFPYINLNKIGVREKVHMNHVMDEFSIWLMAGM